MHGYDDCQHEKEHDWRGMSGCGGLRMHARFFHRHHPHGWHHMPPWVAEKFFGAAKAERGEVRYLILDAIKGGETHGYLIIQTIKDRSSGRYSPSAGAIYPTLQMLEEEGLISSRKDGNKTVYTLTELGRAELDGHSDEVEESYARFSGGPGWARDYDWSELRDIAGNLVKTVKTAYWKGRITRPVFDEIVSVLKEASNRVEEIVKRKPNS